MLSCCRVGSWRAQNASWISVVCRTALATQGLLKIYPHNTRNFAKSNPEQVVATLLIVYSTWVQITGTVCL